MIVLIVLVVLILNYVCVQGTQVSAMLAIVGLTQFPEPEKFLPERSSLYSVKLYLVCLAQVQEICSFYVETYAHVL